jgi:hypothetical protein
MIGPGKLDEWCTKIREACSFSVQALPAHIALIPEMLEDIAAQIRADLSTKE